MYQDDIAGVAAESGGDGLQVEYSGNQGERCSSGVNAGHQSRQDDQGRRDQGSGGYSCEGEGPNDGAGGGSDGLRDRSDNGYSIMDLLPDSYSYKVQSCNVLSEDIENPKFELEVRVNVLNEDGVRHFLSELNESIGCNFNMLKGRQDKRQQEATGRATSKLRGFRKCGNKVNHCKSQNEKQPGKNTDCEACLNFRLENPLGKMSEDRSTYPLWMKLRYIHNHPLNSAEFFKFLKVNQDTEDAYLDMFERGLSPSAAHLERKKTIRAQFSNEWAEHFSKRNILPSVFWVYAFHRKWMDETVGSRDGSNAFEKAEKLVDEYNKNCLSEFPLESGKVYAKIAQSEEGETAIVICNPFMQRVHEKVPQSGDIVFMDATSSLDRNDSKLIHLVCPSPIGGLPLADLILTREDAGTIVFGLNLLKSVLPVHAFFSRGAHVGPQIFMTDDCDSEKKALAEVWPNAVLLLCVFHVLQAMWNWLWKASHNIAHADRPKLLILFRQVLYAESPDKLAEKLELLNSSDIVLKYPQFVEHLRKETFPKMPAWSISRRIADGLPTNNNNTNNYVEASFRYVKNLQFNRHRAFNLTDMAKLVMDNSEFYSFKCIDAANNRIETWLKASKSKYVFKKPNDGIEILEVNKHVFLVSSETKADVFYLVDMQSRCCSCPKGRLLGPCKHKSIVAQEKHLESFDTIPTKNPTMRQIFWYLGTGKYKSIEWFQDLHQNVMVTSQETSEKVDDSVGDASKDMVSLEQETPAMGDSESATICHDDEAYEIKRKIKEALEKLEEKLMCRVEKDLSGYKKAAETFQKTVDRLPASSDSALQKSLCSFAKSFTQVCGYKFVLYFFFVILFLGLFCEKKEVWNDSYSNYSCCKETIQIKRAYACISR